LGRKRPQEADSLISDLVAAEGVYHFYCYGRFQRVECENVGSGKKKGRPEHSVRSHCFHMKCDWFEQVCEDKLYTLEELQQQTLKLARHVSENTEIEDNGLLYDSKHLKRKLIKQYGDHIFFSEMRGRPNVVCFRNMCTYLVSDKWYADREENPGDESFRIVKAAAKLIAAEIREIERDMTMYPANHKEVLDDVNDASPPLKCMLASLLPSKLKQKFIGQTILQAALPQTLISPILLHLGVELDHMFGSKFLTTHLSRPGACSSYEEVLRYKQSVVKSKAPGCNDSVSCSYASAYSDVSAYMMTP